jgi:trk system potassium uptake protein TrkA
MNVIVVGCGRVGAGLAYRLYQKGHRVTVIDQVSQAFDNLPEDFRGRTLIGDVLDEDVLCRAGIERIEGLAAVTNSDSVNAVIGHVARTVFQVPSVVTRNYDPRWRSFLEALGLQVVSSASWGARRIEELLYQAELHSVFSAGNGEVEIYELAVRDEWHGRSVQELLPDSDCLAVALTRAGRATLPGRDSKLESGDVLHVSATLEGVEALRQRLSSQQER